MIELVKYAVSDVDCDGSSVFALLLFVNTMLETLFHLIPTDGHFSGVEINLSWLSFSFEVRKSGARFKG
jgi:hypothetical protein